ncbi:MAG: hypothetical protein M3R63_18565 [Actinomycetota bacterium]|nr:hypothetical protein [Actinomycetota bacterium]
MTRNTRYTAAEHAKTTDPLLRKLAGALRRMTVDLSTGVLWKLLGHAAVAERPKAEVFSGVGFYARPPAGVVAEVVVANIGGADHPVVIASRDEATRAAIADIDEGETATFNDQTIVVHRADGTIEARSANGVAVALATKADIDALIATFNAHTHVLTTGTAAVPAPPAAAAVGTTKLKGE